MAGRVAGERLGVGAADRRRASVPPDLPVPARLLGGRAVRLRARAPAGGGARAGAGAGGGVPGDRRMAAGTTGRGAGAAAGAPVAGGARAEAGVRGAADRASPDVPADARPVRWAACQDLTQRPADVVGAGHLAALGRRVGRTVGLRRGTGGALGRPAARDPHAGRGGGRLPRPRGRPAGVAADVRVERRTCPAGGGARHHRAPPLSGLAGGLRAARPHRRPAAAGAGRRFGGARPEPPGGPLAHG